MNVVQIVVCLQVTLLCLTTSLGLPVRPPRSNRQRGSRRDTRRERTPTSRRLKVLQRALRHLTQEDIMYLARRKRTQGDSNQAFPDPDWVDSPMRLEPDLEHQRQPTSPPPLEEPSYLDTPSVQDFNPAKLKAVPQPPVECPLAEDGLQLFACPTPDKFGRFQCIDDHALCDNRIHCPNGEDEDRTVCMFHKMTMNYFKVLMDAIFGLSRSVL